MKTKTITIILTIIILIILTITIIVQINQQQTIIKLWETSDLGTVVDSVSWSPSGEHIAAIICSKVVVFDKNGKNDLGDKSWRLCT